MIRPKFKIGNFSFGVRRTLVVAEGGVNHNGSLDVAVMMARAAKRAGANVVKFQIFKADKLATRSADPAEYMTLGTIGNKTQYELLKALELSYAQFRDLKIECDKIGILFAASPFDEDSLEFLLSLETPFIKIGSGEITDIPLLERAGRSKLPVILSTGMATLDEIGAAVEALEREKLILLHCTSDYPTQVHDTNLNAMRELERRFGVPVGFSDHTLGFGAAAAAVALGAVVIEKHFTLDRELPGPDQRASLTPEQLSMLVNTIREVEVSLGKPQKIITPSEMKNRLAVRKSVVAAKLITKGQVIARADLACKRPGDGILPSQIGEIVGRTANTDIEADTKISKSMIT